MIPGCRRQGGFAGERVVQSWCTIAVVHLVGSISLGFGSIQQGFGELTEPFTRVNCLGGILPGTVSLGTR